MFLRLFREILLAFASSLGVILGGTILGTSAGFLTKVPTWRTDAGTCQDAQDVGSTGGNRGNLPYAPGN